MSTLPSACDSTSVHPPETNPPDTVVVNDWGSELTSNDNAVTFRHSGWAHHRRKVRAALVEIGTRPRRLARFDLCGSDPWVVVDSEDDANIAIHSNHCHSRWCVPCSRERSARILGNLRAQLSKAPVRFLTLTMRHNDDPLSDQITRLLVSFRRLRRADFWLRAVDGGCAILEIGHAHTSRAWHVHLHCLLQGRFLPHALVKAEWWRITADSNVVDIRPVANAAHAAAYLTKYITKPLSNSVINKPEALAELIAACSRRRLVLTWGTWRGLRLSAKLDTTTWNALCPLDEIFRRSENGDPDAIVIVAELLRQHPDAPRLIGKDPPEPDTLRTPTPY